MDDGGRRSVYKRLVRIERWLKRCMVACKCGSWSSALMEIECMEAETREFRDALWRAAQEEAEGRRSGTFASSVLRGVRVAGIALVIVMAAVFPLSVDQDRPFRGFAPDSIALLTSTESDIIEALRETLSNGNVGRVVLSMEIPENGKEEVEREKGAAAAVEPVRVRRQISPTQTGDDTRIQESRTVQERPQADSPRSPSVEEVISLIQVGQRALRISEPAIRVVP